MHVVIGAMQQEYDWSPAILSIDTHKKRTSRYLDNSLSPFSKWTKSLILFCAYGSDLCSLGMCEWTGCRLLPQTTTNYITVILAPSYPRLLPGQAARFPAQSTQPLLSSKRFQFASKEKLPSTLILKTH